MSAPLPSLEAEIDWQGITLSVTFVADHSPAVRPLLGYSMAHIAVRSIRPEGAKLPITETGYRSHFLPLPEVEELGGPLAYVRAWLDHEASRPAWKAQAEAARQLGLF